MHPIAFQMKIFKGCEEEYKRRHDAIWPEMVTLLRDIGIKEYHIFLEEETSLLFGFLKMEDPSLLENLPDQPLMKKWWQYMSDIMETNTDLSPVTTPMKKVFTL
jgi:L-rhamnose mutarotase